MVWTKACPRCHGDLLRMDDDYEPYLSCLQCGHTLWPAADESRRGLVAAPASAEAHDRE